jgi:hypothetical protein
MQNDNYLDLRRLCELDMAMTVATREPAQDLALQPERGVRIENLGFELRAGRECPGNSDWQLAIFPIN